MVAISPRQREAEAIDGQGLGGGHQRYEGVRPHCKLCGLSGAWLENMESQ